MKLTTTRADRRMPMPVPERHLVKHTPLQPPFPDCFETAIFGKGCFWGVEQSFWELDGVYTTAAGFAGGDLAHPTYPEVCAGNTQHAEVVLVVYDPAFVSYKRLLDRFWKGHRPISQEGGTTHSRDQYRSVIYTTSLEQLTMAIASRDQYQLRLSGMTRVMTEIAPALKFYYAESKHQQYLAKRTARPAVYGRQGNASMHPALDDDYLPCHSE